jgi:soluble lytic murein transglycosylase
MFDSLHFSERRKHGRKASNQAFTRMNLSIGARFFISILFASLCLNASASGAAPLSCKATPEAVTYFQSGKELLEKGEYDDALENFKLAYEKLPVIRDYILFFEAKAYEELNDLDKAGECIRKILKAYPESPLKKRARAFEVKNILIKKATPSRLPGAAGQEAGVFVEDNASLALLESYVADYPQDAEMAFLLARTLKERGMTTRARKMFLKLYMGTSPFSKMARLELKPSDITVDDKMDKASNLLSAFEYKEAEALLRELLPASDDESRDDVLKRLGFALFGQKRYGEAGDVFLKAGDTYNSARSFFRAGDTAAFNEATAKLVSMEDKRVGGLLIAYASGKRRKGDGEEALKILRDVKAKYPSRSEDALWGIAWTYYRSGNCKDALKSLTELDKKYSKPRYRYWKWKCGRTDSSGSSPDIPIMPKNKYKNVYSVLFQLDDPARLSGRPARQAAWTPEAKHPLFSKISVSSRVRTALERFDILFALDMKEDAVFEVVRAANKVSDPSVLLYLCRLLQEAGAYNKSLSLLSRIPRRGVTDTDELLYPLAYWPVVREISRRYMLDPLILLSVMREESRFKPSARSLSGALGLMQIMPQTAYNLDRKLDLNISDSAAIYNIRTNITLGAYFLNSLLKEFKSLPAALAAYNAGSQKVKEWLKTGNYGAYDEFIEDIPYGETRNYVKRVLVTYFSYLDMMNAHKQEQ